MSAGRPFGTYKGKHPAKVNGKTTPMYSRWMGMKQRCLNPKSHIWQYYGGRGIKVCDRWLDKQHGFDNFCDDMGVPPEGSWIERKDNDGDYSPNNCCWATPKEQAANRKKGGGHPVPGSLRQKAIAAGLPYMMVYFRVNRLGWDETRALATPKQERGKHVRRGVGIL